MTGLPTDGAVYLSDGVTPVLPGELLSVAELTGLTFAGDANATGQSAQFTYDVIDPAGTSATGTASLSVIANISGPQTTPASLTVAANSGPTAINITAPTDPNDPTGALTITVLGLPPDGNVFLADGLTALTAGQSLTAAQLTGLKFAPDTGVVAQSSLFSYAVNDPAGNSSLGSAILSIAPAGNILTVGRGKQYSTIAAAIGASHNGDTIQVQAGTYVNDFAVINTNITLEGVGGMVNMVSTGLIPNGKGILVTNGDITINNFSFSGARVTDQNGAGIRYQIGNLILNNDAFFNNEMGLLGGGANPGIGSITIDRSEFSDNEVENPTADIFGHNIYVGNIATLTINNSYIHDAKVGHEIKSRAHNTTILNSRIYDGPSGTGSYSIDLPNGGSGVIRNNVIEQGPVSENPKIIGFGEEGGVYASSSLTISGNTILNDETSPLLLYNPTTVTAQITGNQFFGLTSTQIASGPNVQSNNQFLASEPALDTTRPWSPEIDNFPSDSNPTITSNGGGATAAISIAENTTAVTTVVATDPDAGQSLGYSIDGGADAALFTINAATGALTFTSAPNFEVTADAGGNNIYDVTVQVADGAGGTDTQAIAVTVTDINEAPTITSNGGGATAAVSIAENTSAVTTVVATDPDAGQSLGYSIAGGRTRRCSRSTRSPARWPLSRRLISRLRPTQATTIFTTSTSRFPTAMAVSTRRRLRSRFRM